MSGRPPRMHNAPSLPQTIPPLPQGGRRVTKGRKLALAHGQGIDKTTNDREPQDAITPDRAPGRCYCGGIRRETPYVK
jgi:hypothetical protein